MQIATLDLLNEIILYTFGLLKENVTDRYMRKFPRLSFYHGFFPCFDLDPFFQGYVSYSRRQHLDHPYGINIFF